MIEELHPQLSVRKQCELLKINRNRLSPRQPKRVEGDEAITSRRQSSAMDQMKETILLWVA